MVEAEQVMTQALQYVPVDSKPYVPAFIITNLVNHSIPLARDCSPLTRPSAATAQGNVQFQTRRYHEAEKSYRTAIEIWPAHRESNCNLAILLLHQGREQEGQTQLHHTLNIAPEYSQCRDNFLTTQRNIRAEEAANSDYR